ncbi:hypothetical protein [Winogradskyella aurantiaca]|nr:hypothetical protein [Winogradskyella aurantiaca]
MKFVNHLRKTVEEAPKPKASRPVVRPKKRRPSKQEGTPKEDNFLFI